MSECTVRPRYCRSAACLPIIAAAIRRIVAARRVERLERRRIDQSDIIDAREAGALEALLRPRPAPSATGLAGRIASRAASSACGSASALLPLVRRQDKHCATTARGRRRRGPSARRRSRRRGRGRRPSAGSPPAAGNPSRRTARRRAGPRSSSLATTVATPSKWPGRASPSQRSLTPDTLTVVAKPVGIDVRRRSAATAGRSPPARSIAASVCLLPRIAVEILVRPELQRIDEDRGGDPVGRACASSISADVPGVERAHGRHQRERFPPARNSASARPIRSPHE